jgi:hypothetical protein
MQGILYDKTWDLALGGDTMKKGPEIGMKVFLIIILTSGLFINACGGPSDPGDQLPPNQEIHVKQGETSLLSGSGEYVFNEGVLLDGDGGFVSTEVIFTIENQGLKDLNISEITLSSGNIEDFDLDISGLASTVPSISSTSFIVRFDPLINLGAKSAEVTISNNDEDEGNYTFTLKGYGMKKLTASDGASTFGSSVAFDGDTVIIGASGSKASYIFYRNEGGQDNWGEVKKITGGGCSVAISGDTVVVSNRAATVDGAQQQGRAYVFYRNQGGDDNWGLVQSFTGSDCWWDDHFGHAVAIDEDTVVVGTPRHHYYNSHWRGAAYVFDRNKDGPDNWGEVKKLLASDGNLGDAFGCSVSICGDTIMAGARTDDVGVNSEQGSAYVFNRNQGGQDKWGEVKKLTASDGDSSDRFGCSVALIEDKAVIGAYLDDLGDGVGWKGSAYILYRDQGGQDNWGEAKKIIVSDIEGGDYFGESVAIDGDTVVVCARSDDIGTNYNQGSVYVFQLNKGGTNNWGQVMKITPCDCEGDDHFGESMALSGDTIVAGAWYGSAYIWKP